MYISQIYFHTDILMDVLYFLIMQMYANELKGQESRDLKGDGVCPEILRDQFELIQKVLSHV